MNVATPRSMLAKTYGKDVIISIVNGYNIIHLDDPTEEQIQQRIQELLDGQINDDLDDNCPLCRDMKSHPHDIVYYKQQYVGDVLNAPHPADNYMGKIKRYHEKNAAYFLTTNTENKVELFSDPKQCKVLLVTLEYFKLILDYRLYGFCIMPDHLHLLIHPIGIYNSSYIMKMIKGSFTRKLNKTNGSTGKIWQKGFYDELIRDQTHLVRTLTYMHNNPFKAGLVSAPEEYPFSSHNHYFVTNYAPNQIIEIDKPEL